MAIILEAITSVWHAGRLVQPGDKFSTDDNFAERLIKGGSAKVHKSLDDLSEMAKEIGEATKLGVDEMQKAFMALNLDELKELARGNDVELSAEDSTKIKITQKLIDADVSLDEDF